MSTETMTAAIGMTSAEAYCRCGNSGKVSGNRPEDVRDVIDLFWSLHQGQGHGGTDAATCRRERRKRAGEAS